MKKLSSAVILILLSMGAAHAFDGRIVVNCAETQFDDLLKIQIQETELAGQYQIVETIRNFDERRNETRLSPVFGVDRIEKGEMPELKSWNGYTRKLVRYGRDNYAISIQDECTGSSSMISCKESF